MSNDGSMRVRRDSPSERPHASGEVVASARAVRSTLSASVPRRGTNRSVKLSPARADVERELERRMLLNEQRRSAVLAWILAAIVVGRGIYHFAYGFAEDDLLGRGYTLLLMAAWVGVETHNFLWVSRRIREGREPVRSRAYIRAAFEVAIPTAMLAIMCQYDRPLNVLTSSITYVYFLIIILSSLRLDPTAVRVHRNAGGPGLRRTGRRVHGNSGATVGGVCRHRTPDVCDAQRTAIRRRAGGRVCQPASSHDHRRDHLAKCESASGSWRSLVSTCRRSW